MLNSLVIEEYVRNALKEDIGFVDVTTDALVSDDKFITAYLKTRSDGIFCGKDVLAKVFTLLSDKAKISFEKMTVTKLNQEMFLPLSQHRQGVF